MLVENGLDGADIDWSVIGIGINLNQTVFPGELLNPISLKRLTGRSYELEPFLEKVCNAIEKRIPELASPEGRNGLREAYEQKSVKENKESEKKEGDDIVSKILNELGGEENGQSILLQILSSIDIGSVLTFAGAAIVGMIALNLKSDNIAALDKEIEKQKMEEEAEKAKKEIDKASDDYKDKLESVIDEGKNETDSKIKNVQNVTSEMFNEVNDLKKNNKDVLKWKENDSEANDNEDADDEKKANEEEDKVKAESDKQNSEMDSKGSQFGDKFKDGTANADKQMFGDKTTSTTPQTQPSQTESDKAEVDKDKVIIKDVEKLILPNAASNIKSNASLSTVRKPVENVKVTTNTKNKIKVSTNEEERKEITKAFEYIVKSNPDLKYNIVKNVDDNTIKLVAEMDKNTNKRIDELAELLNDKIDGLAADVSNIQNDVDVSEIKRTVEKLSNVCDTILRKLGA